VAVDDLERRLEGVTAQVADMVAGIADLDEVATVGWAQDHLAKAVVTGPGRVQDIWLAPEAVETFDTESIADLVLEAIQAGYAELDDLVRARADELLVEGGHITGAGEPGTVSVGEGEWSARR
jgi:DNA-binding protein YbaB